MPTAGTHITLIERLALDPQFTPLLGDPLADETDPAGLQMRYAKLGAIGPDLFYALMDYGGEMQDLVNFFAKYSGAVECMGHAMHDLEAFGTKVSSDVTFGASNAAKQTLDETKGVVKNTMAIVKEMAVVVVTDSYNFFTIFEAKRQKDKARTEWYWADYLHYVRSGRFVSALFEGAGDDPNLRAYAYGYLSHYVTDVIGHPFVNQVVGAPFRMYWQRHHLVENFMDGYVWDRWHDAHPAPPLPSIEEAPLDTIRATPHQQIGAGAPYTYARLNDHINIGAPSGGDPIDDLITDICIKIDGALEDIGIAEPMPNPPGDPAFEGWTRFLSHAFEVAYPTRNPNTQPPTNLMNSALFPDLIPTGVIRQSPYPTPDDVGAAYMILRVFLRSATEEKVKEPEFPDIAEDVWNAIKAMLDNIAQDLASITPPPHIGRVGGSFSLSSLWESLKRWVEWACDTAAALAQAALDLLKGVISAAGALVVDLVKALLYLIKKGLFELYKAIRFYLVRASYAMPFTDELDSTIAGWVSAKSLWTVPRRPSGMFPFEEVPDPERTQVFSSYAPWISPELLSQLQAFSPNMMELPVSWPGPYQTMDNPDALLDRPLGALDLRQDGPRDVSANVDAPMKDKAGNDADFGGAIENCRKIFTDVDAALQQGDLPPNFFPDFNLDGDRGYAWPCWDLAKPPTGLDPTSASHPLTVSATTI
jgi:hypothetical protein